MYQLDNFCNTLALLRKKKAWTQTMLAEKLGISPQSVSKWECGVGYPDVTLFPAIAEALSVPIGTLFGEEGEGEKEMEHKLRKTEYRENFAVCKRIETFLANICRVEVLEEIGNTCQVIATGDPVFLHYFDVEKDGGTLTVRVKNPSHSDTHWKPYDRCGYTDENYVQIMTGRAEDETEICFYNYLDLAAVAGENENGNYEVECRQLDS